MDTYRIIGTDRASGREESMKCRARSPQEAAELGETLGNLDVHRGGSAFLSNRSCGFALAASGQVQILRP